jgi:fructokinase
MRYLITSLGEILFDFLPIEEQQATVGFRMYPGGSPFNIAMGTARLGRRAALMCKVSTDFFGRQLQQKLLAERLDPRFVITTDAPTTLAFVAIEHNEPAYAFYGDYAADTLLTVDELPAALFEETAIFHIGSISLLRGTTANTALEAFAQLKGRALLTIDPNIRPTLIRDQDAYRAHLARAFALADLVKISAADLSWLVPGQAVETAAQTLLAHGPALVVVTLGGEGAFVLRRGEPEAEVWRVPQFTVRVQDTVGAGDAFQSGLLASLDLQQVTSRAALLALPRESVAEALRFASAVAAITVTRVGADPPTIGDVAAFLANE